MKYIEKEIEVNAPVRVVYNQWTRFEEFPRFMEGVKEVRQISGNRLFWRAEILGQEVEWEAEIYDHVPGERIEWRSTSGHPNSGAVVFAAYSSDVTMVFLSIKYEPLGVSEKIADALGAVSSRVERDLRRFKKFVEDRTAPAEGVSASVPQPFLP